MAASRFIKAGFIMLALVILIPSQAAASFWFACELRVEVDSFAVAPDTQAVQAVFTILESTLEQGHITDETCGFEEGQTVEVSTHVAQDESGRDIVTEIIWPDGDLAKIEEGDTLLILYRFYNQRLGDKTTWEIQAANPLLSWPF